MGSQRKGRERCRVVEVREELHPQEVEVQAPSLADRNRRGSVQREIEEEDADESGLSDDCCDIQ